MNISMSQRHCSEVSWDQADHMDNIDLGMSQVIITLFFCIGLFVSYKFENEFHSEFD